MRRVATFALAAALGLSSAAARALPFEPGEELHLEVHFLGLHAGDLDLSVGDSKVNGVESWPLSMRARTRGLVGAMYGLDENVVSLLDPVSGASLGYDLTADLDGKPREEHVRYDGKVARVHSVDQHGAKDQTKPILPGAMDALAAVYKVRTLPLDSKARTVPIFTGKKSWPLEVRAVGKERVTTDAGTFDTVIVRCRTHFDGKFSSQRELTVWLSDDGRRLPVKLEADFMIGSMKGELVRYRSGAVAENDPSRR